jgi:membrane-associated progesterone receptor component
MSNPTGTQQHTPAPPRNDPITTKELSLHNGEDRTKPIWVAVKGTVFDVSRNKDAYGTASRALPSDGLRVGEGTLADLSSSWEGI